MKWLWMTGVLALSAQAAEPPKNVVDFFMQLPSSLFGPADPAARQALIKKKDLKNGYLELSSIEWEGAGLFTIFRKSDGSMLSALEMWNCGPACSYDTRFFDLVDGKWTEVTKTVRPTLPTEMTARIAQLEKQGEQEDWGLCDVAYHLPKVGTELKVVYECMEKQVQLARYRWTGKDFALVK
jgi:hypothetical protein